MILTASVIFPGLGAGAMLSILGGGSVVALAGWLVQRLVARTPTPAIDRAGKAAWRMPPLERLAPLVLGRGERLWLGTLRLYLVVAGGLVLVRIVHLALTHQL
ncbi:MULTISPECIES: hypothetical protein [unclassified Sphingomonas]|uniref:hypothetical protein n=1 Tax=unclassified Sphingomonas TaxID=196159 RepID=UPI001E3AD9C6|nr:MULTISPECIES: hypothetical protein [unclassified Sphingomonas]